MCGVNIIVQAADTDDCVCTTFLDLRKTSSNSLDLYFAGVSPENWESQVLSLRGLPITSLLHLVQHACVTF